jgi:hypothetical protein
MITCNLKGGLGNQLFQIFTLISYSIQNSKSFIFPYSEYIPGNDTKRPSYWDTFLTDLKKYTTGNGSFDNITHVNELLLLKHPIYKEKSFNYNPIKSDVDNMLFDGYFQSYKYFDKYKDKLFLLIDLKYSKIKVRSEFFNYLDTNKVACLHFRIGDYKNIQQFHPVLSEKYYDNALSEIPDDYKVIVFCEEQDDDAVKQTIDNLKTKHKHNFVFIDHSIPDWKQMLIMSMCNINVIANSTFSWWAAYFNEEESKKVIYPSLWFGNEIKNNTDDLFLPEWIKIYV